MKTVVYTVDVEPDVEPFSHGTSFGLKNGLPGLFDLLDDMSVPADFFFLGSILDKHEWAARRAVSSGHGIGSHGWTHEYLCRMDFARQLREIGQVSARDGLCLTCACQVICEDRDLLYEEAPQAYKDIEDVIADLEEVGVLRVIASFCPIITYKMRDE